MRGKVCLVTGATSGIGAAAAEALLARGATVVLVGRDRAKCEAAVARLGSLGPNASVGFLVADQSVQAEVRRLARAFEDRYPRLDVLVNNAGGIYMRRTETVDGIERTFALNSLASFLLTNLLLGLLTRSAPSRIVNVASSGHFLARPIDFDNLQLREGYRGLPAYHQSKLANVMFTYELARRLDGTGVTANALDPGMVTTNIGRNNGWAWRLLKPIVDRRFKFRYVSAAEGARTVVYLASSPDVEGVSGKSFVDERRVDSSSASRDRRVALRLWRVCEELTGLTSS